MKKLSILIIILFCVNIISAQVVDIATARTYAQGQTFSISGIVINGGSLGTIRYIQDATAGIAVYDFGVTDIWNQGDSVTVSGEMGIFNGLIQMVNTTSATVHSSNNTLPTPITVTPNNVALANEGQLVKVSGVTFANAGATFVNGTANFSNSSGQSSTIYLRSGHPLIGTTIPITPIDLVGVSSQFNGTPQMLPRDANDITIGANFYMTSLPVQSNLSQTGFDVTWTTNVAGSTKINYGTDPSNLDQTMDLGGSTTNHSVTLTGLNAATVYYVEAVSNDGQGTDVTAPVRVYSTVSNSSGVIETYFNQGVNNTIGYANNYAAYLDGAGLQNKIIDMINNAQTSIDFCIFSINRDPFVTALNDAHNRGVQVRFVTNSGSNNAALQSVTPQFPFISGNGSALMHNKFIVVDADDKDNCWVFMGSMNFTTGELIDNYNCVHFIQDQSLARAYEIEFEEMWGSTGATAGIFNVKFGDAKTDNTPHNFLIGGIPIELYFSPSDGTTNAISNALQSADASIDVAVLSFTRNDLRDDLIDAHDDGVNVRVMIENINDTGGEFQNLTNAGVPTKAHPESGLLHHKYAIVDESAPNSDPIVITGSHNWSSAAENSNDENTLIIHDADMANLYVQEFTARWLGWTLGVPTLSSVRGFESTLFPTPARDILNVEIESAEFDEAMVQFVNVQGQVVKTLNINGIKGQTTHQFDVTDLSVGTYFVVFNLGVVQTARKVMIVR